MSGYGAQCVVVARPPVTVKWDGDRRGIRQGHVAFPTHAVSSQTAGIPATDFVDELHTFFLIYGVGAGGFQAGSPRHVGH
jgi:hypothetical protein